MLDSYVLVLLKIAFGDKFSKNVIKRFSRYLIMKGIASWRNDYSPKCKEVYAN